jgi:hypothetical protein
VSDRRLPDGEVDRLLREALADDLPEELEDGLRRDARQAWRRVASEPRRARWLDWLSSPVGWKPLLPQPALVAAAPRWTRCWRRPVPTCRHPRSASGSPRRGALRRTAKAPLPAPRSSPSVPAQWG